MTFRFHFSKKIRLRRARNSRIIDIILVCHNCGAELDEQSVEKFNTLKQQWKKVLPACAGKCSNAPNKGWVTTGITKKRVCLPQAKACQH